MDDFLANNVNAFSGDVLLCDSYVLRMFPEIVAIAEKGRSGYFFTPESNHIDQLGFKLTTILRLGRVQTLNVLTKDGSSHSLQIPLVVQEATINCGFPRDSVRFFAIENNTMTEISHEAVRLARHLSELQTLVSFPIRSEKERVDRKSSSKNFITVLMGGRSDLQRVKESGMLDVFESLDISYEVSIISSEQNPEELRHYCKILMNRNVAVMICIAGMVPGLPAAVKAHLPAIPVLSVPLSAPGLSVTDIMLASFSVPARRPVIMSGMDEVGLRKASFLACEMMALSNPVLRKRYIEFVAKITPKPDFDLEIGSEEVRKKTGKVEPSTKEVPHNGDRRGL